jgi:hypothetical protein
MVRAAAAVVAFVSKSHGLGVLHGAEKTELLLALALESSDSNVLNRVANWNLHELGLCPVVLGRLAYNYAQLTGESRINFLVSSYRVAYPWKESFLLRASYGDLDDLSLEAIVAGLSTCDSKEALQRIIDMAKGQSDQNRIGAVPPCQ